ncbi:Hypothetical protein PBC10988_11360 [Planctomycetales bacterium 10988]|nr:Hypothetical protein PBC10988_11360 [Planctomycetales bacterium 10988]
MSVDHEKLKAVQEYLEELKAIQWFCNVGNPYTREGTHQVHSWEEAYQWTKQPISKWCSLEGKQITSRAICEHHYEIYRNWNEVAKARLPYTLELVKFVKSYFPQHRPQDAIDWFQSQIVGITEEIYYQDLIQNTFHLKQVDVYRDGHFPCGWYVESEEAFPEKAKLIVY